MELLVIVVVVAVVLVIKGVTDSQRLTRLEEQMSWVIEYLKQRAAPTDHVGQMKKAALRIRLEDSAEAIIGGKTHKLRLIDLSATGAQLQMDEVVQIGQEFEVKFPFLPKPIHCKVMRLTELGRFGVRFEKVPPELQAALRKRVVNTLATGPRPAR